MINVSQALEREKCAIPEFSLGFLKNYNFCKDYVRKTFYDDYVNTQNVINILTFEKFSERT